jgi:hypothetical protein
MGPFIFSTEGPTRLPAQPFSNFENHIGYEVVDSWSVKTEIPFLPTHALFLTHQQQLGLTMDASAAEPRRPKKRCGTESQPRPDVSHGVARIGSAHPSLVTL